MSWKQTLLPILLIFVACQPQEKPTDLVSLVEVAHEKDAFLRFAAVQFDLNLVFGGKERLNGRITLSTNSAQGLIEFADSAKSRIYIDHERVFYTPSLENEQRVRFDAYTWSYFFLFPYKLSDPGTIWRDYERPSLNGTTYDTQKLSFAANTGDAPDDWYIVYSDQESHLIEVAAYIVTANKSVEQAEEDPHAIQYTKYTDVQGIPLATEWIFWEWRAEEGLTKTLGKATLSNIRLLEEVKLWEQIPEGLQEI